MLDAHALTGPYVLDALPDLERAAFARHLQTCSWCTTEVEELREAAARLSAQVTAQPPRRLKAEVMGQTARVRQLPITSVRRVRSLLALAAATLAIVGSGALALTSHHDATVARQSTDR